jgi:hypothetical protein
MNNALTPELEYLGDFQIRFVYPDRLDITLDFGGYFESIPGPVTDPLRAENKFREVFMDHGVLTWPTGYDVDPIILRQWCESGHVSSSETLIVQD